MDALTDWTLASLPEYGAPILVLISFVGSLGIPFPITMVIIAAGAFARAGLIDWRVALVACVLGAALADHSEYAAGRLAQTWLRQRFGQKAAWLQAQSTINRQGAWAILLTRFWLMPLAPAINVIAGSRYPFVRFLVFDVLGQFVWVLLYGGLGYLFAAQWQQVSQAASVFSVASFGLSAVVVVAFVLLRRRPARPIA